MPVRLTSMGLILCLAALGGCDPDGRTDAGSPDASFDSGVEADSGPADAGGSDAGFDAGECTPAGGGGCLAVPCCPGLFCTGGMGGDGTCQ